MVRIGFSVIAVNLVSPLLRCLMAEMRQLAGGKQEGFKLCIGQCEEFVELCRAMVLAVGCIQALQCNKNTCPTGVAVQNKQLVKGLNVEDKTQRIANYHRETVRSFVGLLAASGFTAPETTRREHINRRVSELEHMTYEQLYPLVEKGALLQKG